MATKGRPQRLASDRMRLDGVGYDMRSRSAWLLQVSRLAHRPGVTRREFARELSERGFPGDEWQLSRWESGEHPIAHDTACSYAEVLGIDPAVLSGAIDYLKVSPLSRRPKPRSKASGPDDEAEADDAFDRIFAGQATGSDWHAATRILTTPSRSYVPRVFWCDLTARLLSELYRSIGPAYSARARALALLLDGHPGEESAIEAIREFAAASRSQALTIAAMSMIYSRTELANHTSLEWLHHPDAGAQWGAVNAVSLKLALGHYGAADLPAIEATCRAMLGSPQVRHSGLVMLRGLPTGSQQRIAADLRNGDLLLRSLHVAGERPPAWTALAKRIARGATARMQVPELQQDSMVETLVMETCFGTHYEGRFVSALALEASPYRTAIADEIADALASSSSELVESLAWLAHFLAGPEHHLALSTATAAEQAPLARNLLFIALGAVDDPPTRADVDLAFEVLRGEDPLPMRGASFMLGMHGAFGGADLSGIADSMVPVAEWWTTQGGAIRA